MSIGVISLSTNQRRETGAPFPAGSADNGLSVDPVTGRIVLGNDFGDPAAPARLLNSREIKTDGNFFTLTDDLGFLAQTLLDGGNILIQATAAGSFQSFTMRASINDTFTWVVADGAGGVTLSYGFLGGPGQLTIYADGTLNLGAPAATKNGAIAQINGSCTYSLFFNGISTGAYNIDRLTDRGKLFCHQNATGAITLNLPNMAFADAAGFHFYAAVHDATGVTIVASAGQTININGVISTVGGTLTSNIIGSSIHLAMIDPGAGTWQALSYTGNWIVA